MSNLEILLIFFIIILVIIIIKIILEKKSIIEKNNESFLMINELIEKNIYFKNKYLNEQKYKSNYKVKLYNLREKH
jgi:hypothetical protein